jgi:hypothetical protein
MRFALSYLTLVAQAPQDPCAEPAGCHVQLCLLGLGLVGVAVPDPSWAAKPLSSHAVSVSMERSRPSTFIHGGPVPSFAGSESHIQIHP